MRRTLVSIQKIEQVAKLGEGHTVLSTGEELCNAHVIARQHLDIGEANVVPLPCGARFAKARATFAMRGPIVPID